MDIFIPPHGAAFWSHVLSEDGLYNSWAIAVLMVTPMLGGKLFMMLRQIAFHGSAGVSITDGNLVYLNFYESATPSRLPIANIDHFVIGGVGWVPDGIVAFLNNGTRRYIPTLLFSDKSQDVLSRLNKALAARDDSAGATSRSPVANT